MKYAGSAMICLILAAPARADLGTLRLSAEQGGQRISVFTSPPVLRAGLVEVKVLTPSREPLRIVAQCGERRVTAQTQWAEPFQAAWLDLPHAGDWHFDVMSTDWQVDFDAAVAAPIPSWQALAPWIAWPIVPIACFLLHQWLVRRGERGASDP